MKIFGWFKTKIRTYFLAGLLVIVPLGVTLLVISAILRLMDRILDLIPLKFHPETYLHFRIPGLGLILALLLVMLTGVLVRNYIGRRVVYFGEYFLSTIPLVRPLYLAVKQVIQAIFGETHDAFKRAVLVEYPRKGVYALAFVTGQTSGELKVKTEGKMLNVFLPTTPNPTSGFYLVIKDSQCPAVGTCATQAWCNTGDVVTGGGGHGHPKLDLPLTLSHPIKAFDDEGWYAGTTFADAGESFYTFAICAQMP